MTASVLDSPDIDTFDPIPETVTLESGTEVRILSLKTRQFFRMLRIVTRGAGGFLMQSGLSLSDSVDVFVAKLVGLLLVAVPEAENETIQFVLSMVEPAELVTNDGKALTKEQVSANNDKLQALADELDNPELEDLLTILEAIVKREAEDIQSLGKRLQKMFQLAQRTGQIQTSSSPSEQSSSDGETAPSGTSSS